MEQRLGRYHLKRRLGAGASGEVWEALLHGPSGFRKPVALKLLRAGTPAGAEEELEQEARLGALLAHPNVVATYELGRAEGRRFIAMELVQGPTVRSLLKKGPLAAPAVLELGLQTASGLAHIHGLRTDGVPDGLLHRDIKPGNLLLDPTGQVKVADLGIARLVTTRVQDGWVAGTPGYMPPEQLLGAEDVTSDLFALGMTLYRAATGLRLLGVGERGLTELQNLDALLAHQAFEARTEAALPGLSVFLRCCLHPDPHERFRDAAAFADALQALYDSAPSGPGLLAHCRSRQATVAIDVDPGSMSTGRSRDAAATGPGVTGAMAPFLGRRGELARLLGALTHEPCWVTLRGPGGVGKTRLAEEAASRVELPGGVWRCRVGEVHTVDGLCRELAKTLGTAASGGDPVARLGRSLASLGRALVVFDDLEQLAPHAEVFEGWRRAAPELSFLVTSRVAVPVRQPMEVMVQPLLQQAAVALFRELSVRPVGPADEAALDKLIERLDGLPLAIELAAARTALLSVEELAEQVAARRLLGATPDHAGLWAAFEASWDQLGSYERAALAQLSVFEGGASVRAVQAVVDLGPGAPWVPDVMGKLIQHSLVLWSRRSRRYRMLHTIKEFAHSKLQDVERVQRRHLRWFAQLGTRPSILRRQCDPALGAAVDQDLHNLFAAADRARLLGDRRAEERALLAAWQTSRLQGPRECAERLERAADERSSSRLWARLAEVRGALGDLSGARLAVEQALERCEVGSRDWRTANLIVGRIQLRDGKTSAAVELGHAVLDEAYRHGDLNHASLARYLLGLCAQMQDRQEEARTHLRAHLDYLEGRGVSRTLLATYGQLGLIACYQGDLEAADRWLRRGVDGDRQVRDPVNLALALGNLALVKRELGAWKQAEALLDEALGLARGAGDPFGAAIQLCNLGHVQLEGGDVTAAASTLADGLSLALSAGARMVELNVLHEMGRLELREGRVEDAVRRQREVVAAMAEAGLEEPEMWLSLGEALAVEGQLDEADRWMERVIQRAVARGDGGLELQGWAQRSMIAAARGDEQGCQTALERAEALGVVTSVPPDSLGGRQLAEARRVRAELRAEALPTQPGAE